MDRKIKSLLLGISLRWEDDDQGGCKVERKTEGFAEAFDRITIDYEDLEPDAFKSFLNTEDIVHWLIEHPKAEVRLGYRDVEIRSPEFEDVDYERYVVPFEIGGAVEDFSKSRMENGNWFCSWSVG